MTRSDFDMDIPRTVPKMIRLDSSIHTKNILLTVIIFLLYVNFGNILNIVFFNITGDFFFAQLAPAIKDIYLWCLSGLAILFFLYRPVIVKIDLYFICLVVSFIGVLILSYFLSSANSTYKIYNFRRISTEYIAILTFMFLPMNTGMYYKCLKTILYVGIIVCIFGLIEIFLPVEFWDRIVGLPEYWNNRQYIDVDYTSITQTGGKAYTSDLYFLVGEQVRRMISVYAEATTLGSFFSFLFTYFYFSKRFKYRKIILTLFLISGVLVFSKAFLLAVCIVFLYKYLNQPKIYPVVILSGIFFTIGFYTHYISGKIHGSLSHFIGLYTGVEVSLSKPMGFGLGLAGNRGQSAISSINGLNGGESGLGNVLAQIGLSGLLSVVILLVIMRKFQRYYFLTLNQEYFAIFVATVNWYFIYLLSASSLGFTGNIIFFVFIGLMLNQRVLKEKLHV